MGDVYSKRVLFGEGSMQAIRNDSERIDLLPQPPVNPSAVYAMGSWRKNQAFLKKLEILLNPSYTFTTMYSNCSPDLVRACKYE